MAKTEILDTTAPLNVGDKVTLHPTYCRPADQDVVFIVVRLSAGRSKSYGVQNTVTGAVVQATRSAFVKLDSADILADLPVVPVAFHEGSVVTVSGRGWKGQAGALYVVTGCKADGNYRIAKLGGDNGMVFPKVHHSCLTPASI